MEVLEHCMTTGIEAMLVQAQLRWSGHLVHMSDTRLPTLKKAIFYSQLASGSRPSGHPVKWYKMHWTKIYSGATQTQQPGKQLHKIDRCGEPPASLSHFEHRRISDLQLKREKEEDWCHDNFSDLQSTSVDMDVLPPSDFTHTWELTSANCSSLNSMGDSNTHFLNDTKNILTFKLQMHYSQCLLYENEVNKKSIAEHRVGNRFYDRTCISL